MTKENECLKKNEELNNYSINIGDPIINSNKKSYYFEPFDLSLAYLKPKKLLEEKLTSLLVKNKIKHRLINKSRYILEKKKEDISLSLIFDKLKGINEDKENKLKNIRLNIIKLKRLTGGYESNLKIFENIIFKIT